MLLPCSSFILPFSPTYVFVQNYGVCLVPGSSCACPGFVRVSFANMRGERFAVAAQRPKAGIRHLAERGMIGRLI